MEGVYFYTRTKAITARWLRDRVSTSDFGMPKIG
jgi:hypothetical protein